jgi:hypothetical protein
MFVKNKLLRLPQFFAECLFGFETGWQVLADGTGASLTITRKAYEIQSTVSNKSSNDCIGVIFERCRHWNILRKKPNCVGCNGGVVP